jgi:hypothetical protein
VYWILGLLAIAVVVAAVVLWQRAKAAKGEAPPEMRDDVPSPPPDRSTEWDPRERYDDDR